MADLALVGGKTASLGEMFRELRPLGVRIPDGFAVTAPAYRDALNAADAWPALHALLDGLDKRRRRGARSSRRAGARNRLRRGHAGRRRDRPASGLARPESPHRPDLSVAVRSSATAEDLPNASFAGQHDTYLNIRGEQMLIDAVKALPGLAVHRPRDLVPHRQRLRSLHGLALGGRDADGAQRPGRQRRDVHARHRVGPSRRGLHHRRLGPGRKRRAGRVDPDEFYVHKPTFRAGHRCVLSKRLGRKQIRMVYSGGRTREPVVNQPTPAEDRARFCLTDADVLELAGAAIQIEDHYSRRAGSWRPMDIEWAKDGPNGAIYIVQARPEHRPRGAWST